MSESIGFALHGSPLQARFDGPQLTSDGGLCWLAEAAAALGLCATLVGAGVLGAVVTFGALLVPGVREMDEPGAEAPAPRDSALRPVEDTIAWANDLRLPA